MEVKLIKQDHKSLETIWRTTGTPMGCHIVDVQTYRVHLSYHIKKYILKEAVGF